MEYALLWPHGSQITKIEFSYTSKIRSSERPKITSPHDADQLFRRYWNHIRIRQREEFKCIYLNQDYRVLAISEVGLGNEKAVLVKDKLMLSIAYQVSAASIILCHNHPSGDLVPSNADKSFTRRLLYAAEIMEFRILDHIILSPYYRYYSFMANGLIPCNKNLRYSQKSKEELAKPLYRDSLIRKAV